MKRAGTCYLHLTVEHRLWREDYSEPLSDTIAETTIPLLGELDDEAIRALMDALSATVGDHDRPKPKHLGPVP
jgi:hypothetical protein